MGRGEIATVAVMFFLYIQSIRVTISKHVMGIKATVYKLCFFKGTVKCFVFIFHFEY